MRAVVLDRYGPPEVLRVEDVERPAPREDEVLVRVHATTVTRTDTGLRSAEYGRIVTGLRLPRQRIPGIELAGVVEAVGGSVSEFTVGDLVFGIGSRTNAEFVCVRESGAVAHMPSNTTFEEAAAVCDGACIALSFLKKVGLQKGQEILIYGASGSIGVASVQLAKHLGANVTAVCDTKNIDVVRTLGPDRVVDYLKEDFTRDGRAYDVILDAVGKLTASRYRPSLKPTGSSSPRDRPGPSGESWPWPCGPRWSVRGG